MLPSAAVRAVRIEQSLPQSNWRNNPPNARSESLAEDFPALRGQAVFVGSSFWMRASDGVTRIRLNQSHRARATHAHARARIALRLFEIARVVVRFDHVARVIVKADHRIV